MFGENCVNRGSQLADPFAMDDPHLEYSSLAAGCEVIQQQLLYLAWLEGVQIQNAVDGKLDRFIHVPQVVQV